ncbi:Mce protein [Mycobacterium sp. Aquia_216]|uniref:Mce protein n=1 Tax=Mycobacterium sp. Aquia_216 TaxID=2991729 RepID=UPI00227CA625|nr:Mce protein [Mycobacterium sp. Aquia_216]WAJ46611.1 Mce protein [Mycobacterium sp. Aquia_216]
MAVNVDTAAAEVTESAPADRIDPDGSGVDLEGTELDGDEAFDDEHDAATTSPASAEKSGSKLRLALTLSTTAVVLVAGLIGWLGFRLHQDHQSQQQRSLLLEVGRQGALNLTTISYTEVDADIKRILDSSTGAFYEEFQKRSQPFIDVVNKTQSKTVGTITEAGLESQQGDQAQVLVAVSVHTSSAAAAEQPVRLWRMRVSVQKVGDVAKVCNVEFVP